MSIAFRLLIAASNIAVLFNARPLALELSPSRFEFDTRQLIKVLDRTLAEAQEQARQRAERTAAHRRRAEQLQDQIRQLAAAQDWDAVLTINDQLTKLDPAADPDGLASTAREQITRRREAEQAAAAPVEIPASTLAPPHKLETPPTPPRAPQPMQTTAPSVPSPQAAATRPTRPVPKLGPVKSILSVLWALLPTLTIGLLTPILAPIPFAHAAVRLRDHQGLWLITAAYGFGSLTIWIM